MNDNDPESTDFYEQTLLRGYSQEEIKEIQDLMQKWGRATYPTLAHSIVDHADRHGFKDNYLKYLRKAANFHKKGAKKKQLPNEALRWNKGTEFLIERNNKIISYGDN